VVDAKGMTRDEAVEDLADLVGITAEEFKEGLE